MTTRKPGFVSTQNALAGALDVSPSTIRAWLGAGAPEKTEDGYHVAEWAKWRADREHEPAKAVADDERDWELENKKWLARKRELEAKRLEGTLIERALVEDMLAQRAAEITNGLRNVEHSAAPEVAPAMTPLQAERILRAHHDALLEQYARPLPRELTEVAGDSSDEEDQEAGEEQPRKRGRPKGSKDKQPRRRRRVE